MSAAATASCASSVYSDNILQQPLQQQPQQYLTSNSSFGTLPDTIAEFGNTSSILLDSTPNTTSSSNQTLFQATTIAQMEGQPMYNSASGPTTTMLSMGTPSGTTYIYSTMGAPGADSSADGSSTSSSRTRLGPAGCLNDSGLSTLSSNSVTLMPSQPNSQLLSGTTLHHLQQPQQQTLNICYTTGADSPSKSGCLGMAGGPMPDEMDEFEAMPRDRCNTWPLRRPTLDINAQTSPLIHDRIPEEDNAYDENSDTIDEGCENAILGDGDGRGMIGSPGGFSNEMSPMRSDSAIGESSRTDSPPSTKKSTTRRNAWGNLSYADLITQAIMNSPEKRLTLSQVYEWMVQNVPYFRDKGDSNSSAGWKNSIRHNLSLHSRFMRIQNEGAGKSSWWVINPDAKPGRNPRRRAATMETSAAKGVIDKKRRGARKRVEMVGMGRSAGTSVISSQTSILSQDLYNDSDEMIAGGGSNFDSFRPRTQSTLSIPGNSSRVSPTLEPPGFEDFDFPPWMDAVAAGGAPAENVTEILDRTDQMRLDGGVDSGGFAQPVPPTAARPLLNGVKIEPQPMSALQQPGPIIPQRSDISNVTIKQEMAGVQPPPSYQELNAVRGNPAQIQNPLLRGQVTGNIPQQQKMQGMGPYYNSRNGSVFVSQQNAASPPPSQQQYIMAGGAPVIAMTMAGPQWTNQATTMQQMAPMTCTSPQQPGEYIAQSSALPLDLENLPSDGQMLWTNDLDMETVLRHELSQTRDNQLHFDLP